MMSERKLIHKNAQKGYTLCILLSWLHIRLIMRIDNPTIGIILCSDKEDTVVRFSVLKDSEQLFASKYRMILPTEEELRAELEREIHLIEEQQGGDGL